MTRVELRPVGHVALIEFDNGHGNYFTAHMLDEIADLMREAQTTGMRAIVLASQGRHFCAGADFSAIGPSVEDRGAVADRTYAAGLRIIKQPLPIVVAIQGAAIGGGFGLACAADFRVVAPEARFEANFTRLGFHPGFGLSVTLPHIVGPQAARGLLMAGTVVKGPDAVSLGLAERIAERDDLVHSALDFAATLASRAPLAVQAVRATLRNDMVGEVERVLQREASEQRRLWATADAAIGMGAAQRREQPTFVGR